MYLEVIAYFLLHAVFVLGDEVEVLNRITAADDEFGSMTFGQLHTCDVEREVTLLAVLGFDGQRVFHRQVHADERREGLGEGDVADVVRRRRHRRVGRYITDEADLGVIILTAYPGRVGTVGTDGVLTGVGVREGDGFEVIFHPRQFA